MIPEELEDICQIVSQNPRSIGSMGATLTKNLIKEFAIKHNLSLNIEVFYPSKFPNDTVLRAEKFINLVPLSYFDSNIEGKLIVLNVDTLKRMKNLNGYVLVLMIKNFTDTEIYRETINNLKPNAVIFCLEDFDIAFTQPIFNFNMPLFSIAYKDFGHVLDLEAETVDIEPPNHQVAQGENIFFDIGRGPIVYILSSISSNDNSYGSIYSACSVAFSLHFASSLIKNYNSDFKFRFFFTEENSISYEGLKTHISNNPKHSYYAISLYNIGWSNPVCFYEDAYGENSLYLADKFHKYIKNLNTNISFVKTNTISFLHAPFKDIGIKTAMFGSYPCIISNTTYDSLESVRFDYLELWYQILSGFLRRLHAI